MEIERDYISSLQKVHYTSEAERLNIPITIKQRKPIIVRDMSEASNAGSQIDWSFAREGYDVSPSTSSGVFHPQSKNFRVSYNDQVDGQPYATQNHINAQRRILNKQRHKRCPETDTSISSCPSSTFSEGPDNGVRDRPRVLWADELEWGSVRPRLTWADEMESVVEHMRTSGSDEREEGEVSDGDN